MLRRLKSLEHYRVNAADGDLGSIKDVVVDDVGWVVRSLVVDTGEFVGGRRVLIAPRAFRSIDWSCRRIHLSLTKERIMKGAAVGAPFSDREAHALYDTYRHGPDWASQGLSDGRSRDARLPGVHVWSVNAIRRNGVSCRDGPIGHVEDFIVDDDTWELRFLVIDTSTGWLGKKVLVSSRFVTIRDHADGTVLVSMSRDQIAKGAVWDGLAALNPSYEERLDLAGPNHLASIAGRF
jgi:sporulation protein YlmC with PRC-barrel domain